MIRYESGACLCDVPAGVQKKDSADMDAPCQNFMAAVPTNGGAALALASRTKYGFRHFNGLLRLNLIRSSYDPDEYLELGAHKFELRLGVMDGEAEDAVKSAMEYMHPICVVSGGFHTGTLPPRYSGINISGACVSGIKMSEDGKLIIARLYNIKDKDADVTIEFAEKVSNAMFLDITERFVSRLVSDGNRVSVGIPAYSLRTVGVELVV